MDTVFKTFRAEVKGIGDNGSLDMLIPVSSGKADRDDEVVEPTAFKKTIKEFMKHPVLIAAHDYQDLTNQIGEWSKLKITDEGIEGKPKYYVDAGNEQADWAYYLASNGKAAYSIGFIPNSWEDGDGENSPRRTYKEIELLEISQVIIPSNRDAIMGMRAKGVDPVVDEILDEVEKDLPEEKEIVTKPEETADYIRIPVSEGHSDHKVRTIDISSDKGIKALYCVDCKENITYLFSKDKEWTMAKAKKWVKEHEGKSGERETSQSGIIDEIDYLKTLIEKEGLSKEAIESSLDLIGLIQKQTSIRVITCPHCGGMRMDIDGDNYICLNCGHKVKRLSVADTSVDIKESLTLLSEVIKEQMEVKNG